MQHDEQQLHRIAQDYPWYLFTLEQIAVLCNVSRDVVTKARTAPDSPFFLNKCRPEWFVQWMRNHPEFQLTKGPPVITGAPLPLENEFGKSRVRNLPVCVAEKRGDTPNRTPVPRLTKGKLK